MILILLALLAQVPDAHQAALELYRKHAYGEAIVAFGKALETEKPGSAEYQESSLLLGQSLFLTNHVGDAIPFLEKAPRTSEVLYMIGNAYLQLHVAKSAEATFAEMYGVDAASASAHLITAQMMMRQDLEDDAEKELQQALALNPKMPQVRYLLGELRLYRGAPGEAIAFLKDEIALNPDSSMAYYKLGDAYARRSEWPAAIASLQKSIWLNPDFSGPYIVLGKAYLKMDQLENAEGVLRHAVEVDPHNYSAHYLLGQALIQDGRAEEGRKMLEESQKLKPQQP